MVLVVMRRMLNMVARLRKAVAQYSFATPSQKHTLFCIT